MVYSFALVSAVQPSESVVREVILISCSLLYLRQLEQRLEQSNHFINICSEINS